MIIHWTRKKHYAQCSMDIKECFTCITSQSLTDNSWNWTWYDRDMSNEGFSYINLSMKASHVLKPHQHLGDNLWLDSDADKPTIMQTWNQFTSLENCQGRFVFKSRFNFKGLRPTWHWPHPHFVVPARIAWILLSRLLGLSPSPKFSIRLKTQRKPGDGLKFSQTLLHWLLCSLNCTLSLSYRLWSAVTAVLSSLNDPYSCHQCHIEI